MRATFNHEKLHFYQKTLAFYAVADALVQGWDSRHAITDHLPRAATSNVENLANASAAISKGSKLKSLDYSLGSTLECAACLDIAKVKQLLDEESAAQHKEKLAEIFRMTMALQDTWSQGIVREDGVAYGADTNSPSERSGFHHEYLDVYKVALEVIRWFCEFEFSSNLPVRLFRKLDAFATSIVLNIAEGNGRYTEKDQGSFLQIAHQSTIKLATQLDLCVLKGVLRSKDAHVGKNLLFRVASMTAAMIRGKRT